ncbi:MAG TPA: hypothetical protein VK326_01155 [Solirubrobacterales bacterium]|nr:hypothetical protein [Solirubrobacterales bacterium]
MSPKFLDKLKPYFKTRPRSPTAKQPAASRTAPPSVPTQTAPGSPQPAQAPTQAVAPAPKSRRARRRERKRAKRRGRPSGAKPAAELTARRDQLARQFAELQFDLGGLAYEMAIRGSFRPEVLTRRAGELEAVEAQLSATESAIRSGARGFAGTCAQCGTPYVAGAVFCSSCGNRLAATPQPATPKPREEHKPSEPETASPPAAQPASPARPDGANTPPAAQPQAADAAKEARQ